MYLFAESFMCARGRISLPLTGTWVADLAIDPATSGENLPVVGDPLTISLGEGGFTLQGAVRRVNNAFQTVFARVVGGGGGLYDELDPKSYQDATFGLVLSDILGQIGETLSTNVSADIQNIQLPFWTVLEGPAFESLYNLVVEARNRTGTLVNWRVLPDGTIFLGVESWPAATMPSFDLMSWQPDQLKTTIYATNPSLLPGQTWQSGQVSNVSHVVEPERIRTEVWFLNPP